MTIKELRLSNNLSQREFAKLIGVTQAAINKWERQEVKLSQENQEKIDEVFGLNRDTLRATSFNLGVKIWY